MSNICGALRKDIAQLEKHIIDNWYWNWGQDRWDYYLAILDLDKEFPTNPPAAPKLQSMSDSR